MQDKIFVTRPFLPPLKEFEDYLKQIWDSKWLTNCGKFHQKLEEKLAIFLDVPFISLFVNGTLALITALNCLRITGEVITTPYSFVATTHSLWWNNIKPVFADVDSVYGNLDPVRVEAAITPKTTAILPVHVYGHPCKVDKLQRIADVYGLKLIYDAAHAFGVKYNGQSILNFGDLSVLSFHATKVFNTLEGGAIVCRDKKTKNRIDFLKNFGFADEVTVIGSGINGKMNEAQSALGLLQIKYFKKALEGRKFVFLKYVKELKDISGLRFNKPDTAVEYNYAYFPVFIDEKEYGMSRDELYEKLKKNNIYARRYFYPIISNFSTYKGLPSSENRNLPVANKLSKQVICLPIYPDLSDENVVKICNLIK